MQEPLKTAMTLHERQAKRVEVRRGFATPLVATVVGITEIGGLYFKK